MNIKKTISVITLSLILANGASLCTQNPTGWKPYLLKTIFRVKDVSPEFESKCRGLLHEAGVQNADKVIIGSSSSVKNNVGVTWGPMLAVDEAYLNGLPLEEQRFLIGYEAIHIKNHHMLKRAGAILALMPLCFYVTNRVLKAYGNKVSGIKNDRLKRILLSWPARFALEGLTTAAVLTTCLIPLNWYLGLKATREGTKALNCKAGAISYLEGLSVVDNKESFLSKVQRLSRKYFFNRLDHPPVSWHIAAVKNISE